MAVSVTEPSTGSYPLSESSYSSADEEEFGLFQALPVAEVSVEDSGWEVLPQSVEEYLARVRQEARHLPNVVTSSIDPRSFDCQRTSAVPLEARSAEWTMLHHSVITMLTEFLGIRLKLQQALLQQCRLGYRRPLPARQDPAAWKVFCLHDYDQSRSIDAMVCSDALLLLAPDQISGRSAGISCRLSANAKNVAKFQEPAELESENNGISKVLAVIAGGYFRQDEGLISQTELSLTVNHKL